jgi:dihydroorotase
MLYRKIINYLHLLILVIFCSIFATSLHAQRIDILLKGGVVIDPKNKIDGIMDVAIRNGKILRVAQSISSSAKKIIDVSGLYVSPGFIDMHTHVFHGTDDIGYTGFEITNSFGSVVPDDFTFRTGVTTVVDAGSSGWRQFHTFKKQTIDHSQTRVLAFLSIVGSGMLGTLHAQNIDDMDPVAAVYTINQYPNILVGIKAHHYQGPDFIPIEQAIEAGNQSNVPVMVDFGRHNPPLSLETLLLKKLRPGDIFTHTYGYPDPKTRREPVIDENGIVKPFVFRAQKNGIIFDVGHGAGAFVWNAAISSVEQGFLPDVISSDLYSRSRNAGMKDLSNVMSKFLNMGMLLNDVIESVTWKPAQVIQRVDLGHLTEGIEADVTVFNIRKGDFGFVDARGYKMRGNRKLETELTIRAGEIMWDLNGMSAVPWEEAVIKKN